MGLPERAIAYVDGAEVDFDQFLGQEVYRVVIPTADGKGEFTSVEYPADEFVAKTGLSFHSLWEEPVIRRRLLPDVYTDTGQYFALALVGLSKATDDSEVQISLIGDGGGFVHKGEVNV